MHRAGCAVSHRGALLVHIAPGISDGRDSPKPPAGATGTTGTTKATKATKATERSAVQYRQPTSRIGKDSDSQRKAAHWRPVVR